MWEIVNDTAFGRVRRFVVPGGWLYQVELDWRTEPSVPGDPGGSHMGWGVPVFVPARGHV